MIDREKVIEGIQECDLNGGLIGNCPYKDILSMLKEQDDCENCAIAIEDRQPVVRCKDCKYSGNRGRGIYCQFIECENTGTFHKDDWFCADGKRKESR